MHRLTQEHVRAWLYRVATAVVPLLVAYGVVAESEAALWIGLAGAVLAAGEGALASAFTSTRQPDPDATANLHRHVNGQEQP